MATKKRKAKESKENPVELILTYTESRCGGALINPGDCFTSREDEQIEWYPGRAFVDEPGVKAREKTKEWHIQRLTCEEPVKPGDQIWVVIIRYTTGGTFGRTIGAWHVEATFKNEDKAREVAGMIENDEAAQRKWCCDNPYYKRTTKSHPPEDKYISQHGYKCWQGYFQSFESTQVESFKVL